MKYIPDVIPADKRVLQEYFLNASSSNNKNEGRGNIIRYLLTSMLFFLGLISLKHFPVAILISVSAFVMLPAGKAWIERTLVFSLTFRITAITVSVLLITAAGIDKIYRDKDAIVQLNERKLEETKEKVRIAHEQYLKKRIDSIKTIISENENLIKVNKYEQVLALYVNGVKSAETTEEQLLLTQERQKTERAYGLYLVSRKKYKQAISFLSSAININSEPILYYNRGLCYSNLGQMQDAVRDLKLASQKGSTEAEKLHERINPVRKRVSYYVTRCCDGTTSSATGRGACSHHGGVCNWNDPVYEYYRKYE